MSAPPLDNGMVMTELPDGLMVTMVVHATSLAELEVDIAPGSVAVRDNGCFRKLDLPCTVVPEACQARFRKNRKELSLTLFRASHMDPIQTDDSNTAADALNHSDVESSSGNPSHGAVLQHPRQPPDTDVAAEVLVEETPKGHDRSLPSAVRDGTSPQEKPNEPTNSEAPAQAQPNDAPTQREENTSSLAQDDQIPSGSEQQSTRFSHLLSELHESRDEECTVSDSEGAAAFAELRALLAEGPVALAKGIESRISDGRINVAFCQVLRQNIQHALDAGQPNKVAAFRRIQQEIRTLASAPASSRSHAPQIASKRSSDVKPRELTHTEVIDGGCLHDFLADKRKKNKARVTRMAEEIGKRLTTIGFAVVDGVFNVSDAALAREEIQALESHFHVSEIWVGQQAAVGAQMTVSDIRGDKVMWMCGHHPQRSSTPWSHASSSQSGADFEVGEDPNALQPCSSTVRREMQAMRKMKAGGARRVQPNDRWLNHNLARLLDGMDALVMALRESPAAGRCGKLADRSDAMLAVYPASGARFQAHVDNTAMDGRRLTTMAYFNEAWSAKDGGELVVHPEGATPVAIFPNSGRLVLFCADTLMHEVRPSYRHRYSACVWYYDTDERDRARAEAQSRGRIGGQGGAVSDADNAAARKLLLAILNGNGSATEAEIQKLATEAEALPRGAAHMVAQVTMGSKATPDITPADVSKGLRALTPEGLDALRQGMTNMSSK